MHKQHLLKNLKEILAKTPVLKGVLLFLLAGILYYIFVKVTGLMLPCPFKLITGFSCPGCGATHMMLHILEGKFSLAFWDNPFLFVFGPLLIIYLVYYIYKQFKGQQVKYSKYIEISFLVLTLMFWILRNIWGF